MSESPKKTIYDLTKDDLVSWIEKQGEAKFRANQIWEHLYEQRQPIDDITTLPIQIKDRLITEFPCALKEAAHQTSTDNTHKWLYELHDGYFIETVLMLYEDRSTVCISSQAGCAMGCTFCATGQAGFDRHLTAGEIIEQVARTAHFANVRVSNIVFMGMGEPMANIGPVYEACSRLINEMNFSARHVTVSTVGVVPGMKKMAEWDLGVTLAVSLHSPFDDSRTQLIPINKRYPIADVLAAAEQVSKSKSRRVTFEYAAIDNTNISDEHAHELGKLLGNFGGAGGAHLNVIPLNSTSKFDGKAPTAKEIEAFASIVQSYGPSVTIRKNRGQDIDAACGQLRERQGASN